MVVRPSLWSDGGAWTTLRPLLANHGLIKATKKLPQLFWLGIIRNWAKRKKEKDPQINRCGLCSACKYQEP
jgi:hypothetical protein